MSKSFPEVSDYIDISHIPEYEADIANMIGVSSNSAVIAFEDLGIEATRLRGRQVVDVGAGNSDVVATLCDQGANAVGIDPLYGAPERLHAESQRFADALQNHNDQLDQLDRLRTDPVAGARVALDPLHAREYPSFQPRQRFLTDFDAHPERYQAGSSTALPLPDRSADMILSFNFLSNVDFYEPFLIASVWEAVRVLGRNGSFRAGPFSETLDPHHPLQFRDRPKITAVRKATELLNAAGVKVKVAERKIDAETSTLEVVRLK